MGVHLVFFLHITTGPDNTNSVLALAFGILIVASAVDHDEPEREYGGAGRANGSAYAAVRLTFNAQGNPMMCVNLFWVWCYPER
jgi:hypothetical protein